MSLLIPVVILIKIVQFINGNTNRKINFPKRIFIKENGTICNERIKNIMHFLSFIVKKLLVEGDFVIMELSKYFNKTKKNEFL